MKCRFLYQHNNEDQTYERLYRTLSWDTDSERMTDSDFLHGFRALSTFSFVLFVNSVVMFALSCVAVAAANCCSPDLGVKHYTGARHGR